MDDLARRRGVPLDVYLPAEDSYLLLAVAKQVIEPGQLVIDVGTGSGFLAERLEETVGATVIGVDINPIACQHANDRGVPTIRADLVSSIRSQTVDVVICNPPYLPSNDARTGSSEWFDRALDGGPTGRDVVLRLLADLDRVLTPTGRALLLLSSAMGIETVKREMRDAGFTVRGLEEDEYPNETLAVVEVLRI